MNGEHKGEKKNGSAPASGEVDLVLDVGFAEEGLDNLVEDGLVQPIPAIWIHNN